MTADLRPERSRPSDAAALLAERGPDWLAAVAGRHSRRAYTGLPVAPATLDALERACERFRPYPDARTVLVRDPAVDVFTGIVGSYGKVRNAPHVLLFIAEENADFVDQHVGYMGEGIVLEATALGLDTCWIGGFFSATRTRQLVELQPGESVFAVSPVGHAATRVMLIERGMQRIAKSHQRKCVAELAPGLGEGWPEWVVAAVETARLAPSAVNRQPWRFRYDAGALAVQRDNAIETPKVTKRLDCGIAMLHAELGARAAGAEGTWRDLATGLDVARYVTARCGG